MHHAWVHASRTLLTQYLGKIRRIFSELTALVHFGTEIKASDLGVRSNFKVTVENVMKTPLLGLANTKS